MPFCIAVLTLYLMIAPFDPFEILLKNYVFENTMENWAFTPLEQMLHFS